MAERIIETTEAREDRMLHQSFLKNTTIQPLPYDCYAMRSDSTPADVWYFVTPVFCTCPWMQNHDSVCSHVARARFENQMAEAEAPIAA